MKAGQFIVHFKDDQRTDQLTQLTDHTLTLYFTQSFGVPSYTSGNLGSIFTTVCTNNI